MSVSAYASRGAGSDGPNPFSRSTMGFCSGSSGSSMLSSMMLRSDSSSAGASSVAGVNATTVSVSASSLMAAAGWTGASSDAKSLLNGSPR